MVLIHRLNSCLDLQSKYCRFLLSDIVVVMWHLALIFPSAVSKLGAVMVKSHNLIQLGEFEPIAQPTDDKNGTLPIAMVWPSELYSNGYCDSSASLEDPHSYPPLVLVKAMASPPKQDQIIQYQEQGLKARVRFALQQVRDGRGIYIYTH